MGNSFGISTEIAEALSALLAASACAVASRRARSELRSTWIWLTLSCATWALGQIAWSLADVLDTIAPATQLSWSDLGYLVSLALAIVGLLRLPKVRVVLVRSRLRVALDAILLVAATLFISWGTILGRVYARDQHAFWSAISGIAHPLMDVAMAATTVAVLTRFANRAPRFVVLLAVGIVINTISDSVIAYLRSTRGESALYAVEAVWIVGFALIAIGAMQSIVDKPPPRNSKPSSAGLRYRRMHY